MKRAPTQQTSTAIRSIPQEVRAVDTLGALTRFYPSRGPRYQLPVIVAVDAIAILFVGIVFVQPKRPGDVPYVVVVAFMVLLGVLFSLYYFQRNRRQYAALFERGVAVRTPSRFVVIDWQQIARVRTFAARYVVNGLRGVESRSYRLELTDGTRILLDNWISDVVEFGDAVAAKVTIVQHEGEAGRG